MNYGLERVQAVTWKDQVVRLLLCFHLLIEKFFHLFKLDFQFDHMEGRIGGVHSRRRDGRRVHTRISLDPLLDGTLNFIIIQ